MATDFWGPTMPKIDTWLATKSAVRWTRIPASFLSVGAHIVSKTYVAALGSMVGFHRTVAINPTDQPLEQRTELISDGDATAIFAFIGKAKFVPPIASFDFF